METWEVIKFLTENQNSDKVFISKQGDITYDMYLDDYTKEFIISRKTEKGWEMQTNLSSFALNNILWASNWE